MIVGRPQWDPPWNAFLRPKNPAVAALAGSAEVLRVLDSIQLTDKHKVARP